jgi:ATP-dependent exoDNAse (exonuclease V) beta subunit
VHPNVSLGVSGDAVDQRALIATELDRTMVVEAAAGTGKTTALVGRIVRLIETGRARIAGIVAVTFSEKAAGELKLRLREELERARARNAVGTEASERLAAAVYDFEEAHVSTIHGFCAELLRERPVEAGVDPSFTVLTEAQASRLFDEAFDGWFHQQLERASEGVRRSLRRPVGWDARQDDDEGPVDRLRRAARELREWRDHDATWTRPDYDRRRTIDALVERLAAFAAVTERPLKKNDLFHVDTAPARRLSEEIARVRKVGTDEYDGWEAALAALAGDRKFPGVRKGTGVAFAEGVTRAQAHAAHAALLDELRRFRDLANADLAALLREEIRDCLDRYEERKRAAGALDFLDLLIKARDLVRDCADAREAFRRRFQVILVDEFQDTDPLQSELLLMLASAGSLFSRIDDPAPPAFRPGALFIVGDPKQSIYRFRRADVGAYRRTSDRMVGEGALRVTLSRSFRAVPQIQRAVNAAFRDEMAGDRDSLQADYVPLTAHREGHAGQPAIVALPIPAPYGRREVTLEAIASSQPPTIGEFVRWLVSPECRWQVEGRAIRPSDICLLFRRFAHFKADVTREYVEALEARGVPHLLVGGRSFHEREEVDAVRTAISAIEWPEDELSVYATLHGPLFAIGEEELLEYHALARVFHPYRVPNAVPDRLAPIVSALSLLRDLHASRNHRSVADTIGRLMAATRAHAGFILWRGGEQVLANVLHISELARRYEAEGGLSFRGFVDALREAASTSDAPEAPILEEGSEGVRLMTVHKAKGLEFPIGILADIGCKLSTPDASRHLDSARGMCALRLGGWAPLDLLEHNELEARRDEAEGVRLAYVAATRARDLLVVPAVGDGPFERGWVRPLNRALYPPVDRRSRPSPAEGCPRFSGKDTVLLRPDGMQADASTVRPGAYQLSDPATGEPYTVVWWDPLLLTGTADDGRGVRREDLIAKTAAPEDVRADRARYDAWCGKLAALREHGAHESVEIVTASAYARAGTAPRTDRTDTATVVARFGRPPAPAGAPAVGRTSPEAIAVDTILPLASDAPRPAGRRFGILVHALLAAVPFDATPQVIRDLAEVHARLLGATDDERAEAAAIADRVRRHPLIEAARTAKAAGRPVKRETPVSIVLDGVLIDGQVDLAFDDGEAWVVVDFKTDIEISLAEDVYRRQVALYVDGVAAATNRPARGVLLKL